MERPIPILYVLIVRLVIGIRCGRGHIDLALDIEIIIHLGSGVRKRRIGRKASCKQEECEDRYGEDGDEGDHEDGNAAVAGRGLMNVVNVCHKK